ncbi:hypothetical protein [Agrococcus citreus]|uniref:Excreted virulence factor EspC, type VII ESX diderm n=1 Tax=Agrococcus citreus TaxID=84643 RepID=A0ABP4JMW5_9MICO
MSDIRITYAVLDGAVSRLDLVALQLAGTDATSEAAAAAVGHDGLAARIRTFADSWDDNRERIRESAEQLARSVEDIAAAFRATDARLAADG